MKETKALTVAERIVIVAKELQVKDGRVFCSSLELAARFGREHKNVLRDIEAAEFSDNFRELNFELSNYTVSGQRRTYPMYLMTRDGFAFLVMGFTGKEAAAWKEAYIQFSKSG